MSIDHNQRTVYVSTPYDDRIEALNDQLNTTYVYYGSAGNSKKELQVAQDKNAESYGKSNKVERAISKSSQVYKNESWDLVDAVKDNEKIVENTAAETLPEEMKPHYNLCLSWGQMKLFP
jgi:hypothetical protein